MRLGEIKSVAKMIARIGLERIEIGSGSPLCENLVSRALNIAFGKSITVNRWLFAFFAITTFLILADILNKWIGEPAVSYGKHFLLHSNRFLLRAFVRLKASIGANGHHARWHPQPPSS
jgi:hypothetical protein